MPLQVEGSRIQVLGPVVSSSVMGSIRRARELSDIAPQYVAKSGLCSVSELESSRGGSIKIQHVTGNTNAIEGKSRFPKLDECAHFHYEHVEIGPIQVSIVDDDDLKPLSNETDEEKWWSLSVLSHNKMWLIRRSYDNFRMLDQQLHRCIYDRKFSELPELSTEYHEEQENLHKLLLDYVTRFSVIAGSQINCGPILNWLELDNRGHRLIVPDTDNCPINTPAVAAAYSVKRYTAQAPDEISFEVGDMISVIDMPPSEESIWWRGKRGFQVGFFPCECVAVIGDKVPRNLQFSTHISQPTKPVLRKHGKLIAFFRSFILSRPSRRRLKQSGILKERVFGCDLGEHLLNSGHEIPMVLKCCVEFIESHGLVDGIYRLSGITSNIQKLRNAFDEDRVPGLYEDEAILQDVHSVASLLKMYFRELPNPLCTYQLYHQFVGAVQAMQGDDTRLLKMRDVVQKLPPPHYRTLEYLMRHLAKVSEKGHETGMTSRNVAIVWAPNLLRCKELEMGGVAALQGVGIQAVVTEFLVCYADLIFCDKLPVFSLPPQQVGSKKSRPKSLAISTPTKLLSLEEARSRALLQAAGKVEQEYIEVGGGPANLPAKYHTVIELPGGPRKRMGSKRSPIGWKMLFGKSGRSSQTRKDVRNKTSANIGLELGSSKAATELDLSLTRRRLRPAKSVESLISSRNSGTLDISDPPGGFSSLQETLSPMLLRNNEGKNSGHNRSVSHESYFDQLQDQKGDVALDISEIQVNFDLEESEMRIFSEDETLMSVGSGSLASNSSPRILPVHKFGKSLVSSVNKRLSYPKLLDTHEDRFCTSQSADPSPKKQKINDGNAPRSKLEEQLSSSVGDIQFIDSVSPDQALVQAEVHPIRSPSPVNSVSLLNSCSLAPSSPILPHIPHLKSKRPQSQPAGDHRNVKDNARSDKNESICRRSYSRLNGSTESVFTNQPFSSISSEMNSHTHFTSPSVAEATVFGNDSFNFQNSESTNTETTMCQPYMPLLDLEESSASNLSTPEFDLKNTSTLSENEVFDKTPVKANLEFENCNKIGIDFAKFEEKIADSSVECKPNYENVKTVDAERKSTKEEIVPPKPEERKPRPIHPYVNIPLTKVKDEPGKVLETSFDLIQNPEDKSNRNSFVSIKYETISTESSCDSLITMNKSDESSFLLGFKSINPSPSESAQTEFPFSSSKTDVIEKDVGESEMNLLKECSEWLQGKQEFYLRNLSTDEKICCDFSKSIENSSMDEKSISKKSNIFTSSERDISVTSRVKDTSEIKLCEEDKTERVKEFDSDENLSSAVEIEKNDMFAKAEHNVVADRRDEGKVKLNKDDRSQTSFQDSKIFERSEKKILETNLDDLGDFEFGLFSSKKCSAKPIVKKRNSPQKSVSSGNVRQLLSKFEVTQTAEKELIDFKSEVEGIRKESGNLLRSSNSNKMREFVGERPKTLERLSTRRRTERDIRESPEVQIEKSKSGSHINQSPDTEKAEILLSSEFDLSDPQRRERIEKYKEKRRNYLREKYRSDSFKVEKDDFVLRIKPRLLVKKEQDVENEVQFSEKPLRIDPSSEKKSLEKSGRGVGVPKGAESPSREPRRLSFSEESTGRQRYENPTVSSSAREQSNRRNNFLRFSSERKSAGDFRSARSSSEKKNLSLDFVLGVTKEDKLSPEFLESFYSRRRMTDPARRDITSDGSPDMTPAHRSSCTGNSDKLCGGDTTSTFCIKDITALFEKRDDSKSHKQYLSSV